MNAVHRWLRLATATGLAVDAFVHGDLAAQFDPVVGNGTPHVSQGQLFRLEAVLAVVAAGLVLLVRRRWAVVFALVVAVAGVGAVVLYRYVDVGAFGPVPDMYDPTWYPEKTLSLIAEAAASVASATLLFTLGRQGGGGGPGHGSARHQTGPRGLAEHGR